MTAYIGYATLPGLLLAAQVRAPHQALQFQAMATEKRARRAEFKDRLEGQVSFIDECGNVHYCRMNLAEYYIGSQDEGDLRMEGAGRGGWALIEQHLRQHAIGTVRKFDEAWVGIPDYIDPVLYGSPFFMDWDREQKKWVLVDGSDAGDK